MIIRDRAEIKFFFQVLVNNFNPGIHIMQSLWTGKSEVFSGEVPFSSNYCN